MRHIVLLLIRAYQTVTRSGFPGALSLGSFSGCRSWPTCSEFAYESVRVHGVFRGGIRAVRRVARCSPLFGPQSS